MFNNEKVMLRNGKNDGAHRNMRVAIRYIKQAGTSEKVMSRSYHKLHVQA